MATQATTSLTGGGLSQTTLMAGRVAVTDLLLSALIAGSFGAILTRLSVGAIARHAIGASIVVVVPLIVERRVAEGIELPLLG